MDKKLSLQDKIVITVCGVVVLAGVFIMIPNIQNFAIKIGESLVGRELRDYSKWYKVMPTYGIWGIFYSVFFSFLYFIFKVVKLKFGVQISTKNHIFLFTFFFITVTSTARLFFGNNFFSYFHQGDDSFMDLFNSIAVYVTPNTVKRVPGIYPPFAELPYKITAILLKRRGVDFASLGREGALMIKESLPGAVVLMVYILMFTLPWFSLVFVMVNGNSARKFFYAFIFSLCGIVIWSIERGNTIIYAFLFTVFFVYFIQYDSKKIKLLACICLVIAAGIKLYPAIFGLLILNKKNLKQVLVCMIAFLLFYFIGFLLMGYSIKHLGREFTNVLTFGSSTTTYAMGLNVSIKNLFLLVNGFIFRLSHHAVPKITSDKFFVLLQFLCLACGIFTAIFSKEYWKKLFALSMLCIYIPNFSGQYTMIFLLIPLVYYINDISDDSSCTKLNVFFPIGFACFISLFIIPIEVLVTPRYFVSVNFLIQILYMFFFSFVLFVQAIKNVITSRRK